MFWKKKKKIAKNNFQLQIKVCLSKLKKLQKFAKNLHEKEHAMQETDVARQNAVQEQEKLQHLAMLPQAHTEIYAGKAATL